MCSGIYAVRPLCVSIYFACHQTECYNGGCTKFQRCDVDAYLLFMAQVSLDTTPSIGIPPPHGQRTAASRKVSLSRKSAFGIAVTLTFDP